MMFMCDTESQVYYFDMRAGESFEDSLVGKTERIWNAANFSKIIKNGEITAVKVHFGEIGNSAFVPPWLIAPLIEKIKGKGGKPFVSDTNTLYAGKRKNAVDHLQTAQKHGFLSSVVGAPIIIADGLLGRDFEEFKIEGKHFTTVKIGSSFAQADSMVVVSHFKGHMMAGFGGAIKNIAMGCASVQGKKEQHTTRPFPNLEKCTGCGICAKVCPADAIAIINKKSKVTEIRCIGCGECIGHCPEGAMELNWDTEIPEFVERLTEYAFGVWKKFKGKICFITFVMNVTPECDCFPVSQRSIVRDIGILASFDPIALDQACFDLINAQHGFRDSLLKANHEPGKDKFIGLKDYTVGHYQLEYGEKLGIGTRKYTLIHLNPEEKSE